MMLRIGSSLIFIAALGLHRYLTHKAPDHEFNTEKVLKRAMTLTSRSWEYGTLVQAMLELYNPPLTVFGSEPFPHAELPLVHDPSMVHGLQYAKTVIQTNNSDLLMDGEGSPADPASLGCAALLIGTNDATYFAAARRQAQYLLGRATRFTINDTHSAISHRDEPSELWGDFVYMVPPFLAAFAVATQDFQILDEAVRQCRLHDEVLGTHITLEDGSVCIGLWRHIASRPAQLPRGVCCSDDNVWLTSNAWAVAGITRVLATLLKWKPTEIDRRNVNYEEFSQDSTQILVDILIKMIKCAMHQARDEGSGLLKNYLDGRSSASAPWAYGEAAGTALMASAVYRLAVLLPDTFATSEFLGWANTIRKAVLSHVDSLGNVSPVADVSHIPSKEPAEQTSEGQSMVLLMYSAWRDCRESGVCGD
ncbi:hypothetical protein LTR84_001568 [Exophiala bonariae]|uniref:Uncharacterized protein n=1 Tax=Exophiala bonariae TaxID=1690606 RepID=A0AAV9NF70_9EURO|nr:hypothetical protein LTR84_001568 [Exophiala bonariae]